MSRTSIYSLEELKKIATYSKAQFLRKIGVGTSYCHINVWLAEMRKLQESVVQYNKYLNQETQEYICLILVTRLQSYIRESLKSIFKRELIKRYPYLRYMPTKLNNRANDKAEKTIKKYSY